MNCEDLAVKKVVLRVKVRTIVLSFGPVSFMSLLPVEPMFRRMREESICRAVLMFEEKCGADSAESDIVHRVFVGSQPSVPLELRSADLPERLHL